MVTLVEKCHCLWQFTFCNPVPSTLCNPVPITPYCIHTVATQKYFVITQMLMLGHRPLGSKLRGGSFPFRTEKSESWAVYQSLFIFYIASNFKCSPVN